MPVLGQHRRLSRRRGDLRRVFAAQTLGFPLAQLIGLYIVVQVSALRRRASRPGSGIGSAPASSS
ncbi:MAG: hypothetical protein HYY95_09605 [Candidatus Rokubacteria bacterium]|nr:hypothetical protein [Candidatus Rokubacteria bacterium]MBI3105808.1 hypothetical protein [Candidatus Rokubacteria bacterium]